MGKRAIASKPERRPPFEINGTAVAPGRQCRIDIPVARLPTQAMLSMPVTVVHGKQPGPRLWVSAAIHGDEINGVEIVREVLEGVSPEDICGTLVAVPIVNVFGFIQRTRWLPDRRDLNRSFPGSARGVRRVMAAIGMRAADPADEARDTVEVEKTRWVRASRSGILRCNVREGDRVALHQVLGVVSDAFATASFAVKSPCKGIVIGLTRSPLVNRGDGIFHVAVVA